MHGSRLRVIIADDHPIIADGIQLRLEQSLMVEIVGVATSFAAVFDILATTPADILVLDVAGMHGSAIATIQQLHRRYPQLSIIVFSSVLSMARDLIAAGARGYVVKEDLAQHLIHAMHAVHRGQYYYSPLVAEYLAGTESWFGSIHLAPKEHSVLELLDKEFSTTEIATQLGIDARTVQNYITTIMRKVGVKNRYQLTTWYRTLPGTTESDQQSM